MIEDTDPVAYKELQRIDSSRDNRSVKDTECPHVYWMKKCSICHTLMESDARVNCIAGEATKVVYSELEDLVCSFSLAKRIQKAGYSQRTRLYWVEMIELKAVTLRVKENVTLKGTQVVSAYTVGELVELIEKLEHVIKTTELYREIGLNATSPDKLARLALSLKI